MAVSTTSTNSSNLHLYYVKKLLTVLFPRMVMYPLGKKTKLPKGLGKQVKWLRYSKISSSTGALTEGTAPTEIGFTTQNVTATVQQYGQFAKVSDLLDLTAIDPVIEDLSELFGRAASESIEDLIIASLDSGLPVQYVNKRANDNAITAGDTLIMKELLRAQINLKVNYVKPHESGKYIAVVHPSCEYDLKTESNVGGWLDTASYGGAADKVMSGEFGQLFGMKFLVSDKMTSANNSGSISVKKNYVLGEECFGVVDLDGKNIDMIIKSIDSGGVANPLNQYGTVGYKITGFASVYLGGSSNGTNDRGYCVHSASSL